jgi:hypothetical protein
MQSAMSSPTDQSSTDIALLSTCSLRLIALVGALLPGIACYSTIIYTCIFQSDRIENFTSIDCDSVNRSISQLPPVSYAIGVWHPQSFFWLFVIVVHVPPRLFYAILYRFIYKSSVCEYSSTRWYRLIIVVYSSITMPIEGFGLVALSIVDIRSHFCKNCIFHLTKLIN